MGFISIVIPAILLLLATALFIRPLPVFLLLGHLLNWTFFRIRIDGRGSIPRSGAFLIVANHVAFFDALMILYAARRRVKFMVHEDFFEYPLLRWFFRYLGVIKVPAGRKPQEMKKFFAEIHALLRQGLGVCVFPEGGISDNGLLQHFRGGIDSMLPEGVDVPIIPVRLGMLWGRLFTIYRKKLRFVPLRRLPVLVSVTVGEPVSPHITGFQLRQLISEMGAESEMRPFYRELPLHAEFARRARLKFRKISFKDFGLKGQSDFSMLVRSLILSRKVRELDRGETGGYVGVLLPNGTFATAAILGVLYADRAPTVLNFSAGAEIMRKSADRAGVKLVLTSRKFLEKLKMEAWPEMVCLEDIAPTVSGAEKRRTALLAALLPYRLLLRKFSPEYAYDLQRPAVLLFSSGSTGVPKGVMLSHRNLNCNLFSFWRAINWSPKDRIIGCLPMFHAFGFMLHFALPLVSGTRVIYLANPLDAASVLKLIPEEQVTLLVTTPTFLQSYIRKAEPEQLKSLRLVITGAEKLRCDVADRFKELTGLSIVEGYGCTELSPIVAVNLSGSFLQLGRQAGKLDSVGAPLPGIHVKIADPETLEELPPDQPGMLMVKGGLTMLGYLGDPEGTAKVVKDGYYITGDIAAMGSNGYLTITGRLSRFSKIGGEMVPHEMVERSLAEIFHREERCVAVTSTEDPKRGERLAVFHTVEGVDAGAVIAGLREKNLPNLWIPKAEDFIFIEQLPLLGSGKLDLQHLKKLANSRKSTEESYG